MREWWVYRLAAWDTPLWATPNRREGRFNYGHQHQTQYLSLHPLTPWAEYLRNEEIHLRAEIDQVLLPVWSLRVHFDADPERIDFDTAPDRGLEPDDLVSDDRSACQRLADRLRSDAAAPKAIIVPSAALPGTENLVIFEERVRLRFLAEPLGDVDVPLSLVAERGMTPLGLEALVRHRGAADRHPALEAWEAGDELRFAEPPTAHLAV